jgi:hypothetical protein
MTAEQRTPLGYPVLDGPTTRPRARVECQPGGAITAPTTIDQRQDNSVNKALPWGVIGAVFGGMGFAMGLAALLVLCIGGPAYMDARAGRMQAELRAEFAQGVARTQALAELARKEASTAVDTVDLDIQRRKAREELKR